MADASIFQQYLKPPKTVQEYMNDYDTAEQNKLQLAALRRTDATGQQDTADRNALQQLLRSGVSLDTPEGQAKLYSASPSGAASVLKARADIAKSTAETGLATTHSKNYEEQTSASKALGADKKRQQATKDVLMANNPDAAHQIISAYEQRGDFDQMTANQLRQTVPQDASKMAQWQIGVLQHLMSPEQAAKSRELTQNTVNAGNQQVTTSFDKYTGMPVQGSGQTVQINQSPDNAATQVTSVANAATTDARIKAEGAANRGVQMRGQNMTDARTRENIAATVGKPFEVTGADGKPTLVQQARDGSITPVQGYTPKSAPLKDAPATTVKAHAENNTALSKIDAAIEAIKTNPSSMGLSNILGDTIRQRTDLQGVPTRAIVADIGSLKLHDRSGAAVTASETPRLKPFIPNVNDSPEAATAKLLQLKQEYANNNAGIEEYYGEGTGHKPLPKRGTNAAKPAALPGGWTVKEK